MSETGGQQEEQEEQEQREQQPQLEEQQPHEKKEQEKPQYQKQPSQQQEPELKTQPWQVTVPLEEGKRLGLELDLNVGVRMSSMFGNQRIRTLFISLKKNQTTPRPSEHPPVMGEKMSKRLGGIKRLQIQNLFMAFKQVPRCR